MAGLDWITGFLSRQKNLSLRKYENTSLSRASEFNKEAIDSYFRSYLEVLHKHNFHPSRIFNLDECGLTTVLKPTKMAEKGKKQIEIAASSDRGELVTFIGIVNASGGFLPPVHVYPRLRHPEDYLVGGVSESLALGKSDFKLTLISTNGYSDSVQSQPSTLSPPLTTTGLLTKHHNVVSPEHVQPYPKTPQSVATKTRLNAGKSRVYTDTPEKKQNGGIGG
ncbi:hypothetical protein PR048_010909 [Dryococelus australis]|uniref:Transposase n=1 Tax=Dryococelus australis TaxID=614101 RepID=A0ABQ9I412_9NEOP|nr:hypothetical protein PR048_010909 [Dryococelus australis]